MIVEVDLPGADTARARLAPYRAMGYNLVELSLKTEEDAARAQVMPLLQGKATLVLDAAPPPEVGDDGRRRASLRI